MSFNFLIVDDSSVVRKVLKKTLGLSGIPVGQVMEAENGLMGLEKLKESWVDLIFLDINMPIMNGLEFIKNLRADSEYAQTPVVIVSTEGSETRIEELNSFGVKAYLRKPVTPEALSDAVHNILGSNV
jgi:two-component system chemotaxis response regulator CheY